jgi:hypothetical protein
MSVPSVLRRYTFSGALPVPAAVRWRKTNAGSVVRRLPCFTFLKQRVKWQGYGTRQPGRRQKFTSEAKPATGGATAAGAL